MSGVGSQDSARTLHVEIGLGHALQYLGGDWSLRSKSSVCYTLSYADARTDLFHKEAVNAILDTSFKIVSLHDNKQVTQNIDVDNRRSRLG